MERGLAVERIYEAQYHPRQRKSGQGGYRYP